jgi:hypothetical protein
MHKMVPQVDAAVARDEIAAVADLARIPDRALGEIDPARVEATLEVVKGVFRLSTPVTAADIYAAGFTTR